MAVVQRGDGFMLLKSGGMGKVNTTLRNYFRGCGFFGHFFEMRISLSVSSTASSG